MDISTHLVADYSEHQHHHFNPNDFINPQNGNLESGWEETRSQQVSQDAAREIKNMVEYQTKKIIESPEYGIVVQQTQKSNHQIDFLSHSEIRLGDLIGQGGFNQIYDIQSSSSSSFFLVEQTRKATTNEIKSTLVDDSHQYVVKMLRPDLAKDSARFALCACDIVKEALLMAALDHKHILKIKAISKGGIASLEYNRRPDAFFMVMEKLVESLDQRMQHWKYRFRFIRSRPQDRALFFQERLRIVADIADALAYMHSLRMIHRDLKPPNLGFDKDGIIKIFDFGMARFVPQPQYDGETFRLSHRAGTLRYISPENYKGQPYNLKSDVYSFTILMHHILSLKMPFVDLIRVNKDVDETLLFVQGVRPAIPYVWPRSIRRLLKRGWAQKSSKRPSMQEVHEILQKELD